MDYEISGRSKDHVPQSLLVTLEEIKRTAEERRFVMTSYMQALALYLALTGYGLNDMSGTMPGVRFWIVSAAVTVANGLALYAASRFRSMALHVMARERRLALELRIGEPHSLLWGYGCGVIVVGLSQVAAVLIVVFKVDGWWS